MALQGRVTKAELKKHRTETDAWTAVKGRVYNITGYIHIHPGGEAGTAVTFAARRAEKGGPLLCRGMLCPASLR